MAGALTAAIAAAFSGGAAVVTDPYFEYTTLLLPGNGTNGAQNNTFLDGSTNNFTITRNGNTTQGTFSPFSQTGWGNYFDGTGDFLTVGSSSNFDFGSGDFCLETWFYSGNTGDNCVLAKRQTGTATGWALSIQYFSAVIGGTWRAGFIGEGTTNLSVNTWYHLVVTRSGNTFRYFKNGRLVNSNSSYSGAVQNQASALAIGCAGAAGNEGLFTGYISNARITIGSIPADYQTSSTTPNAQIFTPPTSPLTAISGTSLLTCQSNRFIDNSTNNFTITRNGDTSVVAFSPFNPTASWSAATNGGSGYFDGSGDYLSSSGGTAIAMGTGDFTWELFAYIPAATGYQGFIETRSNPSAGSTDGFGFLLNTGTLTPVVNTTSNVLTSSVNIVANAWNHIALTRSGTTLTVWVNGASGGSTTNSTNLTNQSFSIGGFSVSPNAYLTGYLANIRITKGGVLYTTAFTPPTSPLTTTVSSGTVSLLLNFTNAGIYDATSKNDLETVGNAQISTAISAKWGSGSMYFDGTGDYLNTLSTWAISGSEAYTLEAWIYPTTVSGDLCIYDTRSSSGTGFVLFINSTGKLQVYDYTGLLQTASTTTLTANTWTYIAMVRSAGSSTNTYYVNGTSAGTFTLASFAAATNARIGARNDGISAYNGYMQDFRITKGYARTITASPTAAFPTL